METTKTYTDGMKTKEFHAEAQGAQRKESELLKRFSEKGIQINATLLKLYKKLSVFVSLVLICSAVQAQTELKNFTANFAGQKVKLFWETGSEINSNYFSVERSWNGKNFETVGMVKATGSSTAIMKYSFYDKDYYSNVIYYRLKLTDKAGKDKTLGSIVGVQLKEEVKEITIYPAANLTGSVFIDLSQLNSHSIIIDATDIDGQKIVSKDFEKSVLNSAIELQKLSLLPKGDYIITTFFDNRVLNTTLTVSDAASNVAQSALIQEKLFTLK
ncbi:MAG: hypothetical protein ACHQNT_01135 [Bacteroidia bacterium]